MAVNGSNWSAWLQDSERAKAARAAAAVPAPARRPRRSMLTFSVVGAVVAFGAVGVGTVVVMSSARPGPAPTALPTPAVTSTVTPVSTSPSPTLDPILGGGPGCEAVRTPDMVRGNGTGAKTSGADAVLGFQHAYYVTRSGAAARSFTTPDADVKPAEAIDAGIATIPAGTQYCVTVTPRPDGQLSVIIIETRPDSAVSTYTQVVAVTVRDGQTLITRIGTA